MFSSNRFTRGSPKIPAIRATMLLCQRLNFRRRDASGSRDPDNLQGSVCRADIGIEPGAGTRQQIRRQQALPHLGQRLFESCAVILQALETVLYLTDRDWSRPTWSPCTAQERFGQGLAGLPVVAEGDRAVWRALRA